MTNNSFLEKIRSDLQIIGRKYLSISEIDIFGSYAKGTQKENSDLDIVIFCKDNQHYETIIKEIGLLTIKYKHLIHPVIYTQDKNELENNKYISENILSHSSEIYKEKN